MNHKHQTQHESSRRVLAKPCTSVIIVRTGAGAIEGSGAAHLLQEWHYKTVPLFLTDSQSALAVCKRKGLVRMKHIELKMLSGQEWLKTGTTSFHKVSTHDNPEDVITKAMTREKNDQVWTCSELATIHSSQTWAKLHSNISHTNHNNSYILEEHSQTELSGSQTHSTLGRKRLRQDRRCERRTHHSLLLKTVMNPPQVQYERTQHDGWCGQCEQYLLPRRRPSRMTLHRWSVLVMTSLLFADGIALSDARLAAPSARKRLRTTASLKPSWWTKWTRGSCHL